MPQEKPTNNSQEQIPIEQQTAQNPEIPKAGNILGRNYASFMGNLWETIEKKFPNAYEHLKEHGSTYRNIGAVVQIATASLLVASLFTPIGVATLPLVGVYVVGAAVSFVANEVVQHNNKTELKLEKQEVNLKKLEFLEAAKDFYIQKQIKITFPVDIEQNKQEGIFKLTEQEIEKSTAFSNDQEFKEFRKDQINSINEKITQTRDLMETLEKEQHDPKDYKKIYNLNCQITKNIKEIDKDLKNLQADNLDSLFHHDTENVVNSASKGVANKAHIIGKVTRYTNSTINGVRTASDWFPTNIISHITSLPIVETATHILPIVSIISNSAITTPIGCVLSCSGYVVSDTLNKQTEKKYAHQKDILQDKTALLKEATQTMKTEIKALEVQKEITDINELKSRPNTISTHKLTPKLNELEEKKQQLEPQVQAMKEAVNLKSQALESKTAHSKSSLMQSIKNTVSLSTNDVNGPIDKNTKPKAQPTTQQTSHSRVK